MSSGRHQEIKFTYVICAEFEPPKQVQHFVDDELTRKFPDKQYVFMVDFTKRGICRADIPNGELFIEYDKETGEIPNIRKKGG